jgi:hypothetical protein
MPGGRDDGVTCLGPITASGRAAWRGRGPGRRLYGGRGQRCAGRPGRTRPALRRHEPAPPRLRPLGRGDSPARQRQAQQRAEDRAGPVPGAVCASAGSPGDVPGGHRVRPAGGGAVVSVLPLVCMCLGLLWLRPRPVAAALAPDSAVLSTPARVPWREQFADPVGVWARLQIIRLPNRAAGARTRASQVRCGFCPGSLYGERNGWRELTGRHARPAPWPVHITQYLPSIAGHGFSFGVASPGVCGARHRGIRVTTAGLRSTGVDPAR